MIRKFLSAAAAGLVLGATGFAQAAQNPFSDVPTDHWAYDVVAQLAEEGVVEGYGDTTFRGARSITRYEMAQIVAKAMAKSDVDAVAKAQIDKLAAEFSEELNNLGVRVANLERNADMVKWNGEIRISGSKAHHDNNPLGKGNRSPRDELLFRLDATAEVNDHWHVKARLDAKLDSSTDSGMLPDGDEVMLKRAYAEGKYGNLTLRAGKFSNITLYDKRMMFNNEYSGAQISFGKVLRTTLTAGRFNLREARFGSAPINNIGSDTAANLQSIQLEAKLGKLTADAVYYHLDSDAFRTDFANRSVVAGNRYGYSKSGREDEASIWEIAANYQFDHNWALSGAYADNTKADYFNHSYFAQLDYKGADIKRPGTWGIYAAFRQIGGNVSFDAVPDGVDLYQRGWETGFSYSPWHNVLVRGVYFNGKDMANDEDAQKVFGRLEYFF